METGYNGWKNYATWLVALHLSNEQVTHESWTEKAAEIAEAPLTRLPSYADLRERYARDPENVRQGRISMLADELRLTLEEELTYELQPFQVDLISGMLAEVDWRRIAEHYLEFAEELAARPEGGAA